MPRPFRFYCSSGSTGARGAERPDLWQRKYRSASTLPSADFISPNINFNTNSSDSTTTADFFNNPTFTNQQNGFNPLTVIDNSFVEIAAQTFLNAGTNSFVVGHDDGVVLTFADPLIGIVVNAPGPTPFSSSPFSVNAVTAGLYSFDLKYAECCGGPANLVFTVNGVPPIGTTPEPASLMLGAIGLAGLGWMARIRKG